MDQASSGAFERAWSAYSDFTPEKVSTGVFHHLLTLCALRGDGPRAAELLARMHTRGLPPSAYAHACVVRAYGWSGDLAAMDAAAAAAERAGHPVTLEVLN
jgi:hypothetical protein